MANLPMATVDAVVNHLKGLREIDLERLNRLKIFSLLNPAEVKVLGSPIKSRAEFLKGELPAYAPILCRGCRGDDRDFGLR